MDFHLKDAGQFTLTDFGCSHSKKYGYKAYVEVKTPLGNTTTYETTLSDKEYQEISCNKDNKAKPAVSAVLAFNLAGQFFNDNFPDIPNSRHRFGQDYSYSPPTLYVDEGHKTKSHYRIPSERHDPATASASQPFKAFEQKLTGCFHAIQAYSHGHAAETRPNKVHALRVLKVA